MNFRKNCLSYWYPKLKNEAKVAVPKTYFINMSIVNSDFNYAVRKMFWMEKPTEFDIKALQDFVYSLGECSSRIGFPLFLRTGMTSHKHSWDETCYVKDWETLLRHAQTMAEQSIMTHTDPKNFDAGLPFNVWACRELLETEPVFVESSFGNMPITTEFRFFFKDHKYVCHHPYWPLEAFVHDFNPDDTEKYQKLLGEVYGNVNQVEIDYLISETNKVAQFFDGRWSLDWLRDKNGTWYAIDMACAEDSFHWKGCPHA